VALENGEFFEKTQDLAIHDGLTALFTKGYFLERLKEECKRSQRHNTNLALLMLDIDHFKDYNDKFGHTAGDIVLQKLSLEIADFFKDLNPVISRFGGEEFCVLLLRTDREQAVAIAEQLRSRIEKMRVILRRQETQITVSVGVASFPQDAGEEDELIMRADQAMYSAKQKGRNRVCGI
jgi:diguanylate cyclase (GGDEF)-like protein